MLYIWLVEFYSKKVAGPWVDAAPRVRRVNFVAPWPVDAEFIDSPVMHKTAIDKMVDNKILNREYVEDYDVLVRSCVPADGSVYYC